MDWFFRKTSTNNHVNNYEIEEFPIPAATPDEQAAIASLVEQILAAKKTDAGADVSTLESEINARVYALYGLSADEIAIVEGG